MIKAPTMLKLSSLLCLIWYQREVQIKRHTTESRTQYYDNRLYLMNGIYISFRTNNISVNSTISLTEPKHSDINIIPKPFC
jgi:hypothetical protein